MIVFGVLVEIHHSGKTDKYKDRTQKQSQQQGDDQVGEFFLLFDPGCVHYDEFGSCNYCKYLYPRQSNNGKPAS